MMNYEDYSNLTNTEIFKDEMIDYTGDRMEFYKKVIDDKVLPVLIDVMYNNYRKSLGETG